MTTETIALKDGDIFRWSYRDPGDDRSYGHYHCCSRIAVVRHGRLCDTYWTSGSDGRSFGAGDLSKLDLERIGNLADLDKEPEWKADYYDDADIVNLNHSNSSRDNFYLRKGAKRSAVKMLEVAKYKLQKAHSDERLAVWKAEQLAKAIASIEAGKLDDVHL